MRFFMIFEGPIGPDRRAIFLNMDHVIEVSTGGERLVVHMSDGRLHVVEPDNEKEFRSFLTKLSVDPPT